MFLERAFTKNYKVHGLYAGYAMSPHYIGRDLFGVTIEVEGIGTDLRETRAYRLDRFKFGKSLEALRTDTLAHDAVVILGSTIRANSFVRACTALIRRIQIDGVFVGHDGKCDPVFEPILSGYREDKFEYGCDFQEGKVRGTYSAYAFAEDEVKYAICEASLERNEDREFAGYARAYRTGTNNDPRDIHLSQGDLIRNDALLLIGASASPDYVQRSLYALRETVRQDGLVIGENENGQVIDQFDQLEPKEEDGDLEYLR
jgi:hypothetical protein